jgi:hypothetical protein
VAGNQLEDVCVPPSNWSWGSGGEAGNGGSDDGLGEHFESVLVVWTASDAGEDWL